MELISKFLHLYPDLLQSILQSSDFVLFLGLMFCIGLVVDLCCFFFWGRY